MSKIWTSEIPYFTKQELQCKGSGELVLDIRFASRLPELRATWNSPMALNSCCRSPEHNKRVGGHPNSLHLTKNPKHSTHGTAACDVRWADWSDDFKLGFATLAYSKGWSVGLHNSFCHIDARYWIGLNKAVFLYGSNWSGVFGVEEISG